MLNVHVYVRVRELVCKNERARGEVSGMPIQFFFISLCKVCLHTCSLRPPEYCNVKALGRSMSRHRAIRSFRMPAWSILSNGCMDRICFPQQKRFPDKVRDQISMNNSPNEPSKSCAAERIYFPEWIYYYENDFLISRKGLDISSSRTTVRD